MKLVRGPYVIKDGKDVRFRTWGEMGPDWTESESEALWFFRRKDAELFCSDDEDAVFIKSVSNEALAAEDSR